jgi:hypothetical protein
MAIRPAPKFKQTDVVTIEGQGVFIVPSVAQECAAMRVVCQVTRDRVNKSLNTKLLPDRSFFGYANTIINARKLQTISLEYGKQVLYEFDNHLAQLAMQVHCSTENINENLGVLYQGLSSPIPGGVYPTYTAFFLQPPWLPRAPLDEVWIQLEGGCKLAVWCEYVEIDFLCESAKNTFVPRENDREDSRSLPNPTGQGEGEGPLGGGQDQTNPAPRNGDGNGGADPNSASEASKKWFIDLVAPARGRPPDVYVGVFGPFDTKPTYALGANVNTPPNYSMPQFVNGQQFGLAESYGGPVTASIVKRVV